MGPLVVDTKHPEAQAVLGGADAAPAPGIADLETLDPRESLDFLPEETPRLSKQAQAQTEKLNSDSGAPSTSSLRTASASVRASPLTKASTGDAPPDMALPVEPSHSGRVSTTEENEDIVSR